MRISDWSSDLCSSDIEVDVEIRDCVLDARRFSRRLGRIPRKRRRGNWRDRSNWRHNGSDGFGTAIAAAIAGLSDSSWTGEAVAEIGRASCRERVCQYV